MKKTKKILAVLMALTLVMGFGVTTVMAEATASTGGIDGEGDYNDVVYNVDLPTNLNFAIDLFEQEATDGNQIASPNFYVINRTNLPVHVGFSLTAETVTGLTLVATEAEVFPDDMTKTDKEAYLAIAGMYMNATGYTDPADIKGILFADKDAGDTKTLTDKINKAGYKFDETTAIKAFGVDKKGAAGFYLAPAKKTGDTIDTLDANGLGVGIFQIYGQFNTYAKDGWKKGDINIKGAYELNAIRKGNWYTDKDGKYKDSSTSATPAVDDEGIYADLMATTNVAHTFDTTYAWKDIKVEAKANFVEAYSGGTLAAPKAVAKATVDTVVFNYPVGGTVDKVEYVVITDGVEGAASPLGSTWYKDTPAAGTVSLTSTATGTFGLRITVDGTPYTAYIAIS